MFAHVHFALPCVGVVEEKAEKSLIFRFSIGLSAISSLLTYFSLAVLLVVDLLDEKQKLNVDLISYGFSGGDSGFKNSTRQTVLVKGVSQELHLKPMLLQRFLERVKKVELI